LKTKDEYAHFIASLAQRAILYEVSTTPKPGLVDRIDSGAHNDMDFFTFMASSSALYKGLYDCVAEGYSFEENDDTKLLTKIRIPGINCETSMFQATNGVNTHKGIIFSMGILCAAVGRLYRKNGLTNMRAELILDEVKKICFGLTDRDFKEVIKKEKLTHGESLFKRYGFKGIRGEVESGFNTVLVNAVPVLRHWKDKKILSLNDLFLDILLKLMAESEDTNVIIRGGVESYSYIKSISKNFIKSGGMKQPDAFIKLQNMNSEFIKRNISPGGAADLLAVAIFLGILEGIIK
jgi:triphosphoribosyl-dephospho-CoA synthase